MHRFVRGSIVVGCTMALGSATLAAPAAAERDPARPRARVAPPAIVIGRDDGTSQRRPTSFEVFGGTGPAKTIGTSSSSLRPAQIPQSSLGFDALDDLDGVEPSDTTGALGDDFFVTATNIRMAVYDPAGVEVVAPTLLDSLNPASAGHDAFDPKVVYDQYDDTFVLVYLVQEDSPRLSLIVTVAIPNATADNPGSWCTTSFPGDAVTEAPEVWADYPGVGYNEDRITITTNQFTFPVASASFKGAQVMSLTKASVYDCGSKPGTPLVFVGSQTQDPNGVKAFTIQPAQTVDLPATTQMLLSVEVAGRNSYLVVWRIKDTAAGLKLKSGVVPIGRTFLPPPGTQGGGSLTDEETYWDAGDERLINAFYDADANELYAAHAVRKDLGPDTITGGYLEAAVRWYQLTPATKLKDTVLARKGTIGLPEVDLGWPSVATDGSGNLFVTYNRASAATNEFLSAWVAEVQPGVTAAEQVLLEPGLAVHEDSMGPERWGDYTAINRDPGDPALVATFNQYALDVVNWQQVVNVVRHA